MQEFLMHYGKGHLDGGHSGRYPWGSGEEPYQDAGDFLSRIRELESQNPTYTDEEGIWGPKGKTYTGSTAIAHIMKMSSTAFRTQKSLANAEERSKDYNRAKALYDSGMGYTEIARKMNRPNESSVRSLLKPNSKNNMEKAMKTADFLRDMVEEKGMIDVGAGVELHLGISKNKLTEAVEILKREGYQNLKGSVKNLTDPTGTNQINIQVIGPKDSKKSDVYNSDKINFLTQDEYNDFRKTIGVETITEYKTRDNGDTYVKGFVYPESMDSSRLKINYKEDGGDKKDGIIEIRRGVDDLSLGNSTYAQVRILVDGNRYLKGMAMYSDDIPDGYDVVFNSHHSKDEDYNNLKKIKDDPNNPFGSNLKEEGGQYTYIGKDGKEHLGLINKTREEGDWEKWQDKLPSQFLSKQPQKLAERQLKLAITEKQQEYQDILDLENNTLKKTLLDTFASDCDSAAVHLYAAALPRQKHQVILPITSMKDDEIYAPNYKNGEKVALVRYPHGGTFEIPILTVNNKQKDAVRILGKLTKDCVGINQTVAERLSGADFDGDTVMVIPTHNNTGIKVNSTNKLKDLDGFDHQTEYATTKELDSDGNIHYFNKYGNEVKIMSNTNTEMGVISNLITDMTIAGATEEELARAVKHSMVVIDAKKHELDYRSSERENGIAALKSKYQGRIDPTTGRYKEGASTLISRAKSEVNVPKTQGSPKVNVQYKQNGKENDYYDPNRPEGSLIYKTADDNKLYYVTVKDVINVKDEATGKVKKKSVDSTVFVQDPETKKYKNIYEKSDGNYYYKINKNEIPLTNEKLFYNKGKLKEYDESLGKEVNVYTQVTDEPLQSQQRLEKSTQMEETDDATTLISKYNSRMEQLYATYANTMKAMANQARKESYSTPNSKYNSVAKQTYSEEVKSLNNSIELASKNAPRERQAMITAISRVKALTDGKSLTNEEVKKIKQRELTKARQEVGASRYSITINDKEWEAIQAGALSDAALKKLFKYADQDDVRERATPRSKKEVTPALISRIENYKLNGKTNAEIATALGLSISTVTKYAK